MVAVRSLDLGPGFLVEICSLHLSGCGRWQATPLPEAATPALWYEDGGGAFIPGFRI